MRIDFTKDHFVTKSGKKYFFLDSMPVDYWTQYQMLVPEITFGVTFKNMHDTLIRINEALTTGNELMKGHAVAVDLSYNQAAAIKNFTDPSRFDPILKMSALWIVTEDEDISKYDDRIANAKIKDWKESAISMDDFFLLCGKKIGYFKEIYLDMHRLADQLEKPIQAGTKS